MDIQGISFSSGGIHTIAQMGTLAALLENGCLPNQPSPEWYGCSGGCFPAICGAIGASSAWIRDSAAICDMRFMGDIHEELLATFTTAWGVVSGDQLITMLGRIAETWEPGFTEWTFARLPRLHIIATNLTQGDLTVFDAEHTPTVRILDGVRASIAIPCLFTPWVSPITGHVHCDGAILEYYPWSCVKNKDRTLVVAASDTVIKHQAVKHPIATLLEYLGRVVSLARLKIPSHQPKHWIAINNQVTDSLNFRVSRDERCALFEDGYRVGKQWLEFSMSRLNRLHQHSSEQTREIPPLCEVHHTLSACSPHPNKMSDIHQSYTPQSPVCPVQHPHTVSPRFQSQRRWSR